MITENYSEDKPKYTSALTVAPDNGESADYHEWRLEVMTALEDAGYEKESEAFWSCAADNASSYITRKIKVPEGSNTKAVYVCTSDPKHQAKTVRCTCHLRICPDCARRASARLISRYVPHILHYSEKIHPRFRLRKIVLTTPIELTDPNCPSLVRSYLKAVPKMFDRLLPKKWRSEQGFLLAAEFGPNGHKLHFHVLFYGQFLSNKAKDGFPLATAWNAVTGGTCKVAHISAVPKEKAESAIIEVVKYTTKFSKQDADGNIHRFEPSLIPALVEVLKGTRRVRSYGIFYGIPDVEFKPLTCPDCGSPVHRWCPSEWNIYVETGWTPEEFEVVKSGGDSSLILIPGNKSGKDPPVSKPETSGTDDYGAQLVQQSFISEQTHYDRS